MTTETLDKLFLEISQFTTARTAREIRLAAALSAAIEDLEDFVSDEDNGLGPSPERIRSILNAACKALS